MKSEEVKVGDKVYKIHLEALYNEYNCGVKMTGRLDLKDEKGKSLASAFPLHPSLDNQKLRDKVIQNFVDSWGEDYHKTFKPLKSSSLMFPNDGGIYPPSLLMYADATYKVGQTGSWWQNWLSLIKVLEANEKKFKVRIVESIKFPNVYYGGGHVSKVWMIFPPKAIALGIAA